MCKLPLYFASVFICFSSHMPVFSLY
uniref:Uncharacterized protein n=1 Tax=Arundo donax TaxID=35708 RepID=A0A0A9ASV6_ARUDO